MHKSGDHFIQQAFPKLYDVLKAYEIRFGTEGMPTLVAFLKGQNTFCNFSAAGQKVWHPHDQFYYNIGKLLIRRVPMDLALLNDVPGF